ncbi:hypothetical protein BMS3Bbin16_00271 [archaeon BMS3Bbin16]|nr:hypothetical protein BMS3Bbin16_00271 [archaeon BMS3Bbin16]
MGDFKLTLIIHSLGFLKIEVGIDGILSFLTLSRFSFKDLKYDFITVPGYFFALFPFMNVVFL